MAIAAGDESAIGPVSRSTSPAVGPPPFLFSLSFSSSLSRAAQKLQCLPHGWPKKEVAPLLDPSPARELALC
jgi:hypothetical protein